MQVLEGKEGGGVEIERAREDRAQRKNKRGRKGFNALGKPETNLEQRRRRKDLYIQAAILLVVFFHVLD